MFGYVSICREAMNDEDYRLFQSYYCGLCRATGRYVSQSARMGLSYDITFLAIVLSAVAEESCEPHDGRCMLHPMKKRMFSDSGEAVKYAAAVGTMLTYLKLIDDVRDDKSLKAAAASVLFLRGARKARKEYPECYNGTAECLKRLTKLENENCPEIDRCADCFAEILKILFVPDFVHDEETRRILAWLGYNIGRWIYVADAYNDIDRDRKNGAYNPFLAAEFEDFEEYKERLRAQLEISLTFTLESAAASFELLKTHKNRSLIEHIIYRGLKAKQNAVLKKTGEDNESV